MAILSTALGKFNRRRFAMSGWLVVDLQMISILTGLSRIVRCLQAHLNLLDKMRVQQLPSLALGNRKSFVFFLFRIVRPLIGFTNSLFEEEKQT